MPEEVKVNIPSVSTQDLEKLIKKVKEVTNSEETEITFEFLLASLFPTCWKNIQVELGRQYTLGYMQGQKDLEIENREKISVDLDCYCE